MRKSFNHPHITPHSPSKRGIAEVNKLNLMMMMMNIIILQWKYFHFPPTLYSHHNPLPSHLRLKSTYFFDYISLQNYVAQCMNERTIQTSEHRLRKTSAFRLLFKIRNYFRLCQLRGRGGEHLSTIESILQLISTHF